MKRMEKAVALVLSGVMLTSLVLCACKKADETDGTVNVKDSESESEELWTPPAKLNEDNIKKAQEYCSSVDPEGHEGISVYLDGIRGDGSTLIDDRLIFFSYQSNDSDSIGINVMRDTGEVSLSIYTMYGDTGYAVNLDFSLGEFEKTFDKVCEDPESVGPYNYDALDSHKEDIKKDFAIIFARIVAFSDVAFPELVIEEPRELPIHIFIHFRLHPLRHPGGPVKPVPCPELILRVIDAEAHDEFRRMKGAYTNDYYYRLKTEQRRRTRGVVYPSGLVRRFW